LRLPRNPAQSNREAGPSRSPVRPARMPRLSRNASAAPAVPWRSRAGNVAPTSAPATRPVPARALCVRVGPGAEQTGRDSNRQPAGPPISVSFHLPPSNPSTVPNGTRRSPRRSRRPRRRPPHSRGTCRRRRRRRRAATPPPCRGRAGPGWAAGGGIAGRARWALVSGHERLLREDRTVAPAAGLISRPLIQVIPVGRQPRHERGTVWETALRIRR
jgi:hypothetical protein